MGVIIVIVLLLAYVAISASVNLLFGIIIPLLVWATIGWFVGHMMRGSGYGPLGNVLLGVGGGIVGSILFRILGWGGDAGSIIVGIIGAVAIVLVARLFGNRSLSSSSTL